MSKKVDWNKFAELIVSVLGRDGVADDVSDFLDRSGIEFDDDEAVDQFWAELQERLSKGFNDRPEKRHMFVHPRPAHSAGVKLGQMMGMEGGCGLCGQPRKHKVHG